MKRSDAVCGDETCYRGTYGLGQGYLFKDGPCDAPDCQWPKNLPTRKHFTDGPQHSIKDAGAAALKAKTRQHKMKRPWNKLTQDKAELIQKLYKEGYKLLYIAYEAKVCETTVKVYARQAGLKRRESKPKTSQDKIDLIRQRHSEGIKVIAIAYEVGVSESTVKREIHR